MKRRSDNPCLPPKPYRGRSRLRGAASIEAVIVLPVFVLLFVSVLYVRDQAVTKQAAEMKARSCAWLYSAGNCETIPPGCSGIVNENTARERVNLDVAGALAEGQRAIENDEFGAVIAPIVGSLLGPALDQAFGRSLDARVSLELERPGLYGGGKNRLAGRHHLACNLTRQEPRDVALDAWKMFRPRRGT